MSTDLFHSTTTNVCVTHTHQPLIVAATKALLRHKLAVSDLEEFGPGTTFERVLPEKFPEELKSHEQVRRVIFCSGKIYYELLEERRNLKLDDVALVRVEQLSPFPFDKIALELNKYPNAEFVWSQEEPKNMGAWYFVQDRIMTSSRVINGKGDIRPAYCGRKTMASPSEGSNYAHQKEQARIIKESLVNPVSKCGRFVTHQ
jgi:2-oxoglutarate dehydrogenase E1 component